PLPLQRSSVHGLPSPVQVVPAGSKQVSAASSHASAHSEPPAHGSPPWVHTPPLQTSAPLQKRPSSHGAVLLVCRHTPVPLHWSFVHTLPSLVHAVPGASSVQVGEQQSPASVLPSSHVSPASITPLPQTTTGSSYWRTRWLSVSA